MCNEQRPQCEPKSTNWAVVAIILSLLYAAVYFLPSGDNTYRIEPQTQTQYTQPVQDYRLPQSYSIPDLPQQVRPDREFAEPLLDTMINSAASNMIRAETVTAPVIIENGEVKYSPQFLADCALGQSTGRRVSPNCPADAAERLGTGR